MTPAEPLTPDEEAAIRLRAGHSIIWGPGTEASDPLVNDRLWQAVQDRRRLLAAFDESWNAALAATPTQSGAEGPALDWLGKVIDAHTDACPILRTASEGGAETDLDSAFHELRAALRSGAEVAAAPGLSVDVLREAVWQANMNNWWGEAVDTTDRMTDQIAAEYARLTAKP